MARLSDFSKAIRTSAIDMLKEMGSEFWGVPVGEGSCELFPLHAQWFVSGRSALSSVVADAIAIQEVRKAALPSWCCESMIEPIEDMGIEVIFYPVTFEDGGVRQDISAALSCDLVLVMGYFGLSDPPQVPRDYEGIVIEDLTHSLLSTVRCERADYRFGSLRKWCGVWTGGFAWNCSGGTLGVDPVPCDQRYVGLRRRAMEAKAAYMVGGEDSKGYLATFSEAEGWLDNHMGSIMRADPRDEALAKQLDVDGMRNSRRSNVQVLLEGLLGIRGVIPVFYDLRDGDCPLFLPVLVDGRDSLRRHLIENGVYCPVHWPVSDIHELDDGTRAFYDKGLSLICDQRYRTRDMQRIVELIRSWQKTS